MSEIIHVPATSHVGKRPSVCLVSALGNLALGTPMIQSG